MKTLNTQRANNTVHHLRDLPIHHSETKKDLLVYGVSHPSMHILDQLSKANVQRERQLVLEILATQGGGSGGGSSTVSPRAHTLSPLAQVSMYDEKHLVGGGRNSFGRGSPLEISSIASSAHGGSPRVAMENSTSVASSKSPTLKREHSSSSVAHVTLPKENSMSVPTAAHGTKGDLASFAHGTHLREHSVLELESRAASLHKGLLSLIVFC